MRRKIVVAAVAALAVIGAGAALAATQLGSPQEGSKAVIEDAAKQLGISPAKLSDALKKALENRVDAAVAAGAITKEQGDALKARIQSDGLRALLGGRTLAEGGDSALTRAFGRLVDDVAPRHAEPPHHPACMRAQRGAASSRSRAGRGRERPRNHGASRPRWPRAGCPCCGRGSQAAPLGRSASASCW